MPLYEYFCPPCSSQFEVLRPVSQMDQPAVCPSGHTTNNRVISLFSVPRGLSEVSVTANSMAGGDACCSPTMGGHGGCSCC